MTKACNFCESAFTNPGLSPYSDLSYHSVGSSCKGFSVDIRAGNRKPLTVLFWRYNERSRKNEVASYYIPKFCPECGRKLCENDVYERSELSH